MPDFSDRKAAFNQLFEDQLKLFASSNPSFIPFQPPELLHLKQAQQEKQSKPPTPKPISHPSSTTTYAFFR